MKSINRDTMIKELLKTGIYKKEELVLLQDEILMDLYLKRMLTTGKMSLDEIGKPWVQYYQDRPYKFLHIDDSLYNNYVEANKDNWNNISIFDSNNQRSFTHNEIKQITDAFANGLIHYGINSDSRIGVMILGSYEEPICLLGPNKNGSVIKYIDFTKGPEHVKHDIENSNLDIIFMDEMFLPLEPFVNEKQIPVVILNAKNKHTGKNYIMFDEIIKVGATQFTNDINIKSNDEPSVIINSSGTTGTPKPIVHSNKTINTAIQKILFTDYPMNRDNFILKSIPSHIGLGLFTTMYSSLLTGTKVVLATNSGPEESIKFTIQFLKNFKNLLKENNFSDESKLLLFTAPMFYRMIFEQLDSIEDLSFVDTLLAAGSKMGKEELEIMNKLYASKNCPVSICNGYGQNEQGGAVALNTNNNNQFGSGGYPVIGTNVKIINIETLEELQPYEEGRIIEKSNCGFLEYESLDEETQKSKIVLPDGIEYFDTKDIGYIDDKGFIYITGRASRVLIRFDVKIAMDMIETKIRNHKAVRECVIIGQKTKGENEEPIAIIELEKDYKNISVKQLVDEIQNSNSPLTDIEMPVAFEIVDHIPYNNSGKADYRKVEFDYKQKVLKK